MLWTMAPTAIDELLERLRAALDPREEVLEAYLFGSRARGDARAGSDVDVAVYLAEPLLDPPPFGHGSEIAADLMAALGTSAVDLVVLNQASPLLYHRVLRDGIRILSRRLEATTTREGQALSRYCDWVPQMAKIDAQLRARIVSGEFGR
jgi:hypothetical protein